MLYSTLLGGTGWDRGVAVAIEPSGQIYVGGNTYSSDFPSTPGVLQPHLSMINQAQQDAFVAKLSADGRQLIFSTYLGGSESESLDGLTLDSNGDVLVAGVTASTFGLSTVIRFPVTPNAYRTEPDSQTQGISASLVRPARRWCIRPSSGGPLNGLSIASDGRGSAYLTGRASTSTSLTTTPGAFQSTGGGDAFVMRVALSSLAFSLSDYQPKSGGNSGQVTVSVVGSGFQAGLSVWLHQEGLSINYDRFAPGSIGSTVVVDPLGVSAQCTFDLRDRLPGSYDIVAMNPNADCLRRLVFRRRRRAGANLGGSCRP